MFIDRRTKTNGDEYFLYEKTLTGGYKKRWTRRKKSKKHHRNHKNAL